MTIFSIRIYSILQQTPLTGAKVAFRTIRPIRVYTFKPREYPDYAAQRYKLMKIQVTYLSVIFYNCDLYRQI